MGGDRNREAPHLRGAGAEQGVKCEATPLLPRFSSPRPPPPPPVLRAAERKGMTVKWIMPWQPNPGTTVNTQILMEVSQCAELINGVKDGRWKSTLTFYRPILRDMAVPTESPKDLMGLSLHEQPSKHYFITRVPQVVIEADSSILAIMEKLQSYKSRVSLTFEGPQYKVGDFQVRVGKVVPSNSENLRGIMMEVDYLPLSSLEKARLVMEDFKDIWQETVTKKSLPGHFKHIEPNFGTTGSGISTARSTQQSSTQL